MLLYTLCFYTSSMLQTTQPIACIIDTYDNMFFNSPEPFKENTDALSTWILQSLNSPSCPPLIVSKNIIHAVLAAHHIFKNIARNIWDFDTYYDHIKHIPYLKKPIAREYFNNLRLFGITLNNYESGSQPYKNLRKKINKYLKDSEHIFHIRHKKNHESIQFYVCAYVLNLENESLTIFEASPSLYILVKKNTLTENFQNLPYPTMSLKTAREYLTENTYVEQSAQDLATLCSTTFAPYLKNAFMFLIGHGSSQYQIPAGYIAGFTHSELKKFIESLTSVQTLMILACHAGGQNISYIPDQTPCDLLIMGGIDDQPITILNLSCTNMTQQIKQQEPCALEHKIQWTHFIEQLAKTKKFSRKTYIDLVQTIAPYKKNNVITNNNIYLFKKKLIADPARPLTCSQILCLADNNSTFNHDDTDSTVIIVDEGITKKEITFTGCKNMPTIIIFTKKFYKYCQLKKITAAYFDFKKIINSFIMHINTAYTHIVHIHELIDQTSTKTDLIIAIAHTDWNHNIIAYYDANDQQYYYFAWITNYTALYPHALPDNYVLFSVPLDYYTSLKQALLPNDQIS